MPGWTKTGLDIHLGLEELIKITYGLGESPSRHGKTWRHRSHVSRSIRTTVRRHQDCSQLKQDKIDWMRKKQLWGHGLSHFPSVEGPWGYPRTIWWGSLTALGLPQNHDTALQLWDMRPPHNWEAWGYLTSQLCSDSTGNTIRLHQNH